MSQIISDSEREAFYKTVYSRRDVRREFLPKAIPEAVLSRILTAAHHAPSVGFMQPWDFIVIESNSTKAFVKQLFTEANQAAAEMLTGERKKQYKRLKLEGIQEAPLNICVTCDRSRTGNFVLGRTSNLDMDLYSTVCAIQNLWLAARAENIGMGWVSILDENKLKQHLNIPERIIPVAYLCLGYVSQFHEKPDLERTGWLARRQVDQHLHSEKWQKD
jgi:5,6-dimethylbenzimidazole synthase